jgi:hypothetical protein
MASNSESMQCSTYSCKWGYNMYLELAGDYGTVTDIDDNNGMCSASNSRRRRDVPNWCDGREGNDGTRRRAGCASSLLQSSRREAETIHSSKAPYWQMNAGSAACATGTSIQTKEECKAAFAALGLSAAVNWDGAHSGIPVGCSTASNGNINWNTATTGAAKDLVKPVCKTSSSSALTQVTSEANTMQPGGPRIDDCEQRCMQCGPENQDACFQCQECKCAQACPECEAIKSADVNLDYHHSCELCGACTALNHTQAADGALTQQAATRRTAASYMDSAEAGEIHCSNAYFETFHDQCDDNTDNSDCTLTIDNTFWEKKNNGLWYDRGASDDRVKKCCTDINPLFTIVHAFSGGGDVGGLALTALERCNTLGIATR